MTDEELNKLCEFILKKIANKWDGEHYDLYPYFTLENGELLDDNGIDPKRVVSQFEKYGLSEPLIEERCELTELGIEVGKGIGFIKHKENEKKKNSNKEKIEKRKNRLVNFKYFIDRPKTIIGILLIVLAFGFGITNLDDVKDYFKEDEAKIQKTNQESMIKGEVVVKELEISNNQGKSKELTESKNDSLKNNEKNP